MDLSSQLPETAGEKKLSGLSSILRPDGTPYYCFSEVKTKVFSNVAPGTLKSWIRYLRIHKPKCTNEEHSHFKTKIPDIAKGAFKLISAKDALELISYCESRETHLSPKPKRQKIPSNDDSIMRVASKAGKISIPPTFCSKLSALPSCTSDSNIPFDVRDNSGYSKEKEGSLDSVASFQNKANCIGLKDRALPIACNSGDTKSTDSLNFVASFQNKANCIGLKDCAQTGVSNDAGTATREVAESVVLRKSPGRKETKTVVIEGTPNILVESSDSSSCTESDCEVPTESPLGKSKSPRRSRKLSLSELDENVKKEIENLTTFYTRSLNTQRAGPSLQAVSIDKIIERLLVYFKYVKGFHENVSLHDVEDGGLVEGFCNFLRSNERNLQSITVSRYISALISVVRFLHRDKSSVAQENLPSLSRLRALQSQLEFDARRERKPTEKKSILYEEILDIARHLLHQFEDARCGVDKARALMNFCILLFYTHVTGRCKEFVTLKIIECESSANSVEGNFLVYQRDALVLLCNDFKTKRIYGPDRTVLHNPQLEYYIRLYINSYRTKLLQGNAHNYFLVNSHGEPFSVPSFNKYIGELFEKNCNLRLNVNDLRHSIITYFLSLPEEDNTSHLLESLASVMKHTVRTQRRFYDDRSMEAKKAPALSFLASKANSTIFGDENNEGFDTENKELDDGYVDALPVAGDIVALVASNSSTSSPQILLAKILRFRGNKTEALLAHFEEVSENMFKMITGKSYTESTTSLIFPVDLVYRPTERVYELRSNKLDLHRGVGQ